jgi:hypothetical protein
MGVIGNAPGINRWSFPAVGTYSASQSDSGNAVSSYNTPTSSLTVALPSTTSIGAGWMMGFATDNGKTMNVQVNGVLGGNILYPAGATGTAGASVTLAATNYEYLALQFDGSNFRIASITPRSAAALGMLGHQIVTRATPRSARINRLRHAPSIGGNDSAGRVRVGASTNGGRCTITLRHPGPIFQSARFSTRRLEISTPDSHVDEQCRADRPLGAGDSIVYQCVGYQ